MINMYKECYEYAKKVGYSVNLMGEMARKYHISVDVAFGYARDYYVYMLGNSIDSWNQLINQVEDNRSEDNKKLWKMINSSEELYKLYEKFGGESLTMFEAKLPKYCYEYCESVLFDIDSVKERASELKIPYYRFRTYAKDYALDVLGHDKFELVSSRNKIASDIKKKGLLTAWVEYSSKRKKCYELFGGGDYDEFKYKLMKQTYEYARVVNFDKDKMTKYGNNFDISYQAIRRYIVIYAKEYLGMDERKIEDMFNVSEDTEITDRLVILWINDSEKRRNVYIKLGKLPYKEFRMALFKMCYEYAVSVSFDANKLRELASEIDVAYTVICNYLKTYAIKVLGMSEDEWSIIRNKSYYRDRLNTWINNSIKHQELYEKLGGGDYITFYEKLENYCYSYVSSVNYDYKKISEFSLRWDISIYRIKEIIKAYGNKNSQYMNEINKGIEKINLFVSQERYKMKDGKISGILVKIERSNDIEEIRNILVDQNIVSLYNYVSNYVIVHHREKSNEEKDRIIKDLRDKILMSIRNEKIELPSKEEIALAVDMINDFILSDICRINDYCEFKKISVRKFEKMCLLVRDNNSQLYEMYQLKINRYRNRVYAQIVEKINVIVKGIKDGIIEDEMVREFDLFDYYMITRIPFDSLLRIASDFLNSEDMKCLKGFIGKNREVSDMSANSIINMSIKIGDREILYAEKIAIIDYLRELNLPINYRLFSIILKKYLAGKYFISNSDTKKLTKVIKDK